MSKKSENLNKQTAKSEIDKLLKENDNELVIKTFSLTKNYKYIDAVKDLNIEVYKNSVVGFLGPNGAGKSTTIRMLTGLIKPTEGRVEIFGKDLIKNRVNILKDVGALVEKPAFYDYLTGRQNLEWIAKLHNIKNIKDRIDDVLKKVSLFKRSDDLVKQYSSGMKMRLAIAGTILKKPKLLFLDEPTNDLDPQGVKIVRSIIKDLAKTEEMTIFVSSHLLYEVQQVCDYVCILEKGKLIKQGSVSTLLNTENDSVTLRTISNKDISKELKNLKEIIKFNKSKENEWSLTTQKNSTHAITKNLISKNIDVSEIFINESSLEDYFIKITKEYGEHNAKSN